MCFHYATSMYVTMYCTYPCSHNVTVTANNSISAVNQTTLIEVIGMYMCVYLSVYLSICVVCVYCEL